MGKKSVKTSPQIYVLDGSIALSWFFEDETDDYADSVQDALVDDEAIVPSLWPLEIANVLVVGERRSRTTEEKVTTIVSLLDTLPIRVDDQTVVHAWGDTLRLARTHSLSVYDACYLELALRRSSPLATLDNRLRKAATAVGITMYTP